MASSAKPPSDVLRNYKTSPAAPFPAKPSTSTSVYSFYPSKRFYLRKPLLPAPLLSLNPHRFPAPTRGSRRLKGTTRVSTAPVEHAPPAPDIDFRQEISRLASLRSRLAAAADDDDRLAVLDSDPRVRELCVPRVSGKWEVYLLKCLVAAGQGHVLGLEGPVAAEEEPPRSVVKEALYALAEMIEGLDFGNGGKGKGKGNDIVSRTEEEDLRKLLKTLEEVERFYDCIGGIIGYQIMVLELLAQSTVENHTMNWSDHIEDCMGCQFLEIHAPRGLDLSKNTQYASRAALWGIEGLPDLGEIYPLGGSADRLGLVDPDTGECLPAAMLPYCGRSLLEGLIRDLQAREFLYFKLYGTQCITPVAIMTSSAKNNHERVTSLCEEHGWFGRGRSSFKLFEQPLVPAISAADGQWLITKPLEPVCKPGGHGVIWKLAYDKGVFDWFYNHGRKGATVRQVSNVVAATDLTMLALAGIGLRHQKKLGFASCQRTSGATEGVNVLLERKNLDGKWGYGLSCIEYTEFDKFGITSRPESSNGLQVQFPANTNILYVDLQAVELVASSNNEKSLPGMVLNTKKEISFVDNYGYCHSIRGGRLECTMQNIADNFLNTYSSKCDQSVEDDLDTFLVYNERRRVTSSAKRKRRYADSSLHQTPEGSLLDIMRNAYDLLSYCNIQLPEIEGNENYVDSGPPFLILLHPSLGPLWEVTRQKFDRGSISKGSELQLEISEFAWRNVKVDGSLMVIAENVMGSTTTSENGEPILRYGYRSGRCKLENVHVLNQGINWSSQKNIYWKHEVQRFEACKVILHGNAEFEASNVTLQGDHVFEVPAGHKMVVTSGDSGLNVHLDPLEAKKFDTGSWYWDYKINGSRIRLELVES